MRTFIEFYDHINARWSEFNKCSDRSTQVYLLGKYAPPTGRPTDRLTDIPGSYISKKRVDSWPMIMVKLIIM